VLRPDDMFAFQPHASAWGSYWNPHKPQADAWGSSVRSCPVGKQLFIRSKHWLLIQCIESCAAACSFL